MKKNLALLGLLAVAAALILHSCYPGGPSYYSDMDIVLTNYEEDFNFSGIQTYFMPDTVLDLADPDGEEEPVKGDLDDYTLEQIETNLAAMGWTKMNLDEIDESNQPDIIVVTHKLITRTSGAIYYPPTYPGYPWYGGWGGWYGGWGGYGYPVYYSYSTGTLIIDMYDPATTETDDVGPVWKGVLDGLLSNSRPDHEVRIERGVAQCFKQPPFAN